MAGKAIEVIEGALEVPGEGAKSIGGVAEMAKIGMAQSQPLMIRLLAWFARLRVRLAMAIVEM